MPPQLPYEFEYVPLEVPLYYQCHTSTPFYPQTFLFNVQDIDAYPQRHWQISIYAVLMASCQPLASPARIPSARSDAARDDVNQLIQLYRRRLTPPSIPNTIPIQELLHIQNVLLSVQQMPPSWNTTAQVQESLGNVATGGSDAPGEAAEQASPVQMATDESDKSLLKEGISAETAAPDLPTYEDDPVVTPAVLSSRINWRPTESRYGDEGSMRFATSSDFVTNPKELQE
ncbi:hypothetical protein FRC01_012685 [Tulasnella sp. 417]|nr:hypothetical protein FRC01_012685 [Tulasnella sp. 417]